MANERFKPVEDYISSRPEGVRKALQEVRAALTKALPGAEEAISYGIPAFKVHGRAAVFFAGWTRHYSLYPSGSAGVMRAFKAQLARYEVARGTIRFPMGTPVPTALIARIAKFRAKELAEGARAGVAAAKKRKGLR